MALKNSTLFRNLQGNAIGDAFNSGSIEIRTGSQPATGDTAVTGTLLCTIALPADAFGAASSGVFSKAGTWSGTAVADGTAGYARFKNSGGTVTFDCSIGESASDLIIDDDAIVTGSLVTCTGFTFTVPAS